MTTKSAIPWTEKTWNPVTGCTKVSEGCRNCYAERVSKRTFAGQTVRERFSPINDESSYRNRPRRFTDVRCHPERLDAPLRWRKPRRVFVNSMSDLFHEDVPDEFIDRVVGVMAWSRQHTYQVLTKRPERMRRYQSGLSALSPRERSQRLVGSKGFDVDLDRCGELEWPLPWVWLGVSVEDQKTADKRIPILLETPAAVRFVSYEPALGPVDFTDIVTLDGCAELHRDSLYCDVPPEDDGGWNGATIDWLIVGGESGPRARPCDVAWIRSAVAQCRSAGVPVFVKQLGENVVWDGTGEPGYGGFHCEDGRVLLRDPKGGASAEWPHDLRVRDYPRGSDGN